MLSRMPTLIHRHPSRIATMIRILMLMSILLSFFSSIATAQTDDNHIRVTTIPETELNNFAEIYRIIELSYATPVSGDKLLHNAIRGMVTSLDPYSNYYSEQEFHQAQDVVQGEQASIGVVIEPRGEQLIIASTADNSPARRAGIEAGDILLNVDGEPALSDQLEEIKKLLQGEAGEVVKIAVVNQFAETQHHELVREALELDAHLIRYFDGITYIRIGAFNKTTLERLQQEIVQAKNKGLKGLIVDLRNNPGGVVKQALSITDLFLDEGVIISTKGRQPEMDKTYQAQQGDILDGLPLIIMINKGSASASEIVAGSLQDNQRAMIVGQKSYGKASIQSMSELPSGAGLKLTVGHYYRPSGEPIEKVGIAPDVWLQPVALDADDLLSNIALEASLSQIDVSQLMASEQESFRQQQMNSLRQTDPNLLDTVRLMQTLIYAHSR